jgi:hypothetical protein
VGDDEDRHARPDGLPYDARESDDDRRASSWDYVILAVLVAVIVALVATGVVPVFSF